MTKIPITGRQPNRTGNEFGLRVCVIVARLLFCYQLTTHTTTFLIDLCIATAPRFPIDLCKTRVGSYSLRRFDICCTRFLLAIFFLESFYRSVLYEIQSRKRREGFFSVHSTHTTRSIDQACKWMRYARAAAMVIDLHQVIHCCWCACYLWYLWLATMHWVRNAF